MPLGALVDEMPPLALTRQTIKTNAEHLAKQSLGWVGNDPLSDVVASEPSLGQPAASLLCPPFNLHLY